MPSRRVKLRLENLDKRPLIEPMLPMVDVATDAAPDIVMMGAPVLM